MTDEGRVRTVWHALQELGLRWIIGGVASLVVLSGSTSAGVAVWAAKRADIDEVRSNTRAIAAVRDSLVAVRDVDNTQDRLILGLGDQIETVEAKYDSIVSSQATLKGLMERLLCRMDGTSPNRCDLIYR